MRITFICPDLSMGGGTRVVAIYAQELTRRGHDVRVVALPPRPRGFREQVKSWFKVRARPLSRNSHFDRLELNYKVIDTFRPVRDDDVPDADVVIATWWETAEWVHALSPRKGKKIYFIQHHEVFPYLPARSRETYRLPMHKIVVAEWLRQVMVDEYGDRDVDVVPNSVDHGQFYSPERGKQVNPTVGLLYSLTSFKGVGTSLAALELVARTYPDLRVVSFGSERVRPEMPLPAGADFRFDPPQSDIRLIYGQCDVWLTCSQTEGFNLPAMEAMACRTPVVSTATGWPAEAIKSKWNGMLLEVDARPNEVADAVGWVLGQPDPAWRQLSANAYQTVAASSWEANCTLFEGVLFRVLGEAGT